MLAGNIPRFFISTIPIPKFLQYGYYNVNIFNLKPKKITVAEYHTNTGLPFRIQMLV